MTFSFQIGKSLKPLLPAIELYSAFTKYMLGERATEVLPLLQFVVERGNTTVYEWRYGEPPLKIEPDPVNIEFDDEEQQGSGDQVNTYKKICLFLSMPTTNWLNGMFPESQYI